MANQESISHSRLLELLHYDARSGAFRWLANRGGRKFDGVPGGHKKTNGYVEITVDGWRYLAHRLAWFYHHGEWPQHYIDHINGIRDDNRIDNLRDVPHDENIRNVTRSSRANSSGLRGVSLFRGRYRAEIQVAGIRKHIGVFDTAEEASRAYIATKESLAKSSYPRQ